MPICKLCLRTVERLRDSHVVPAWAYRKLRAPDLRNPNPVVMNDRIAIQTSNQVREHLLCAVCEQHLNREGERYASLMAYDSTGRCAIYDAVGHTSAVHERPHHGTPTQINAAALDCEKLCHFASGVFWKASACRMGSHRRYSLGERYHEEFRRYLLRERPFPANASVQLAVIDEAREFDGPRASLINLLPAQAREGRHRIHDFIVCGLFFRLSLGRLIPDSRRIVGLEPTGGRQITFFAANQLATIQQVFEQFDKISDRTHPPLARTDSSVEE